MPRRRWLAWVTTIDGRPYVLYSRRNYHSFLKWQLGADKAKRRRNWARATEGSGRLGIPDLRLAVEQYDLGAVCLAMFEDQQEGVVSALRFLGFELIYSSPRYSVWVLSQPLPSVGSDRGRE